MDKCGNLEVNHGSEKGRDRELAKLEMGRSLVQFCRNRRVTSACWTMEAAPILETAEQRLTPILGDNSL
ncbi:hypothetical protein EAG_15772 [Camponotus floridanus]|uniref:Uncharacterized protein n=1 Tax=Camponotus floridanus TaxID=104421 RepID=E2A4A0_CAMFO|nr:hypothetical protein EAG_15772 [Camponotus floridanus]